MDTLFSQMLERFPTFLGLIILAYVLYRQNERLLSELLDKIDELEERLRAIEDQLRGY